MVHISCRKDIDTVSVFTYTVDYPTETVLSSIFGRVLDVDGVPIEGAQVVVEGFTYITDENGFYLFKDVSLNRFGTSIIASKAGYFEATKIFEPKSNQRSYLELLLVDKPVPIIFDSRISKNIKIEDIFSLNFEANSIIDENGDIYEGSVSLYFHYYDITSPIYAKTRLGDGRGVNQSNEVVNLNFFFSVNIEIEGENGEKLTVRGEDSLEFLYYAPPTLLEQEILRMPLWFFDTKLGIWIESDELNLVDNFYVGNLSHFASWGASLPKDNFRLDFVAKDTRGNTLSNLYIEVSHESGELVSEGRTNETGHFSCYISENESLIITAFSSVGTPILTKNIETNSFQELIVNGISDRPLFVSGTIVSCDNNGVSTGYVRIRSGQNEYVTMVDNEGRFRINIIEDNMNEIEIVGYDLNANETSEIFSTILTKYDNDVGFTHICKKEEHLTFQKSNDVMPVFHKMDLIEVERYWYGDQYLYEIKASNTQKPKMQIKMTILTTDDFSSYLFEEVRIDIDEQEFYSCIDCSDFTIDFDRFPNAESNCFEARFKGTLYWLTENSRPVEIEGDFVTYEE